MNQTHESGRSDPDEERLPFHAQTVLRGVWRRRRQVVLGALASLFCGVVSGYLLGSRVYESSTLLLYDPHHSPRRAVTEDLATLMNLVKIPTNLREVRQRLELTITLDALGGAIRVEKQNQTALLTIAARSARPRTAADIANTARDVFLRSQSERMRRDMRGLADALTKRLGRVVAELDTADTDLQVYAQENNIVDLDKEAQWFLEELTAVDMMLEEARSALQSNQLQRDNIDQIIADLRVKIQKEHADATLDGLGTLNIRIDQIRDAISDDARRRAMVAELSQREIELEQARRMFELGAFSRVQLGRAQNAYDRQLAYTHDTEKTAVWRLELEELQSRVIPGKGAVQSEPLLRDIMLRAFDIELDGVTLAERITHVESARGRVQSRLDSIPLLERGYMALAREVKVRERLREKLEMDLADAETALEAEPVPFSVISEALPPVSPLDSTRKLIFYAVVAIGTAGSIVVALLVELLDPRVRSVGEAEVKLDLTPIGVLPRLTAAVESDGAAYSRALADTYRRIACRLLNRVPGVGKHLLVVSATRGEGTHRVATELARAVGRQARKVLLIEAIPEEGTTPTPVPVADPDEPLGRETSALWRRLCAPDPGSRSETVVRWVVMSSIVVRARLVSLIQRVWGQLALEDEPEAEAVARKLPEGPGLGEYLSSTIDGAQEVERPSDWPGVSVIHPGHQPSSVDLVASERMDDLIESARARFDLVITVAAPLSESSDALALTRMVDGVIFVVESRGPTTEQLKRALFEIEEAGPTVVGVILNRVDRAYSGAA